MNINKSHKKAPQGSRKARLSSKPIERVSTRDLIRSIKEDIKSEIEESGEPDPTAKPKRKV